MKVFCKRKAVKRKEEGKGKRKRNLLPVTV